MISAAVSSGSVLDKFPWVGDRFRAVKEEGKYVSADCPLAAHRNARVRLWLGWEGDLIFGCYGGCNKLEILRAVGATWKDCFPTEFPLDAVKREPTAYYPYRDEAGAVLYRVVRLEPGYPKRDGTLRDKALLPQHRNAGGRWEKGLPKDIRRVLYRLPELLAADPARPVLLVAGEKDADSLAALDIVSTTSVFGESAAWPDEYSAVLAGRHVVVVQDRDSAGARRCNECVGSLLHARAASVRRAILPEKDATAFLNDLRRRGVSAKPDLRRELGAALAAAPAWRLEVA